MNSGAFTLLIFFGIAALVAIATVSLFRLITRFFGLKQVLEDGVALTENGLEVLTLFGIGKMKLAYADVESVEMLLYKGPLPELLPRFRFSARWVGTRPFQQVVVIKLKKSHGFTYLLSTPKNPQAFVEQLESRIRP